MPDFAYQLYSSRNAPSLAETLRMLKGLGYAAVEGYGALYADTAKVDELKAALHESGLAMPTGHFGLDMLEGEPDRVLEIAEALGIETIYCPFIAPDQRPGDAEGYLRFGARLQEAGKPIRDAGLGFGWHNHAFELEELDDGVVPLTAIFEGGPELEWEADVAWIVKGGADPFRWIGAYKDRLTAVHIKDIAPEGRNPDEDSWADVGHGTLDWPRLLAALEQTSVRHFIIEHDNPSDPARFAERSLAALRSF
jgi:sugar phosphate isomerase/epimerase